MEAFSEKMMEDAIVSNPEKYINEKGLKLLSRQYRIGSYIFDLLFEDRHGGKLIVELQKGTLDRIHTYKILDYYHEYKEQNPQDFIDIMVIANVIPAERKRRLSNLGIAFKEVVIDIIINSIEDPMKTENNSNRLSTITSNEVILSPESLAENECPNDFIILLREKLNKILDRDIWNLGGRVGSLTAKHLPLTKVIGGKFTPQIWITRPDKYGKVRCSFELIGNKDDKEFRDQIAASLRSSIGTKGRIRASLGSTIVRLPIDLFIHKMAEDDIAEFCMFLDEKLLEWCEKQKKV
jgi:hypothetical protein